MKDDSQDDVIDQVDPWAQPSDLAIASSAVDSSAAVRNASERGDRLWMDFRRCAAFDVLYYGGKPLEKTNTEFEDIYAVLAISCPPQNYFGPLREVASQFLAQIVGEEGGALIDAERIDDTVAFLYSAMADALTERVIDLCASLQAADDQYDDTAIYEVFHAMIDSYDPRENQFLGYSYIGGFALLPDAAARTLDRKEAIYYEVSENIEADAEYATISGVLDDLYDNDDAGDNYDNDDAASENVYGRSKAAGITDKLNYDNDDAAFEASKLNYDNEDAASARAEVTYALASDLGIISKNKFRKEFKKQKATLVYDVAATSPTAESSYGIATAAQVGADHDGSSARTARETKFFRETIFDVGSSRPEGATQSKRETIYDVAAPITPTSPTTSRDTIYDIAGSVTNVDPRRLSTMSFGRNSIGAEPMFGFASKLPQSDEYQLARESEPQRRGVGHAYSISSEQAQTLGAAPQTEIAPGKAIDEATLEAMYNMATSPLQEISRVASEVEDDDAKRLSARSAIYEVASPASLIPSPPDARALRGLGGRRHSRRSDSYLESLDKQGEESLDADLGLDASNECNADNGDTAVYRLATHVRLEGPGAALSSGGTNRDNTVYGLSSKSSVGSLGKVSREMAVFESDADFLEFQAQFQGPTPSPLKSSKYAASASAVSREYAVASRVTLTLPGGDNDEMDDSMQNATRNIAGLPETDEVTDHHTHNVSAVRVIEGLADVGQETDDAASGITYNVAGNFGDETDDAVSGLTFDVVGNATLDDDRDEEL